MVYAVQFRFSMPLQQWNGILTCNYIIMFFEQHHMCLIKYPENFRLGRVDVVLTSLMKFSSRLMFSMGFYYMATG